MPPAMNKTTLLSLLLVAPPLSCQEPETSQKGLRPKSAAKVEESERNLRMTPAVRAVQRAADSVVSIYIVHKNGLARRGNEGYDVDGQGSGVILDETGLVITNWHVVSFLERNDAF